MTEELIDHRLAKALTQYDESEQAREDANHVSHIAALYEQKGDLRTAFEWYNYASTLANHANPALVRKAADIERKLLDRAIGDFETWLAEYGNTENAAEVRSQLDDLKKRRAEGLLMYWPSTSSEPLNAPSRRVSFIS